ncbi:hypothetical protein ACP4OV_026242 [Aristida adscensionis]
MHAAARKFLGEMAPTAAKGPDAPTDRDVIIILAALLCALISVLAIGLVARWFVCCGHRESAAERAEAAAANRGVKKSVLRAIPTVAYAAPAPAPAAGAAGDGEGEGGGKAAGEAAAPAECAICLAEFEDGDTMRVLPQCAHGFHAACIDRWLRGHSSCPSCRRIIVVELPPREQCGRCGARPGNGAAAWKPSRPHFADLPPFLP